MMDWSDRHCRHFLRLLAPRTLLYTEMIVADAILRGDRARLLDFDASEHPVALQLGGADPSTLAMAARIGAEFGYDEINLNVGCPSDRVQGGRFGACLMAEPELVGDCVAAMKAAVSVPVTVKCRIGIDDQDTEQALELFARAVDGAGADALIVHARKAWLKGLSPKENREVPPLDHQRVYRLKAAHPHLTVVLNGPLDRELVLSVQGLDGKARDVSLRPISYPAAQALLYEHWLNHNRKVVADISKGKLGYLHISAMSMPNFRKFEEELVSEGAGRDGLVIDVRENPGGSITDHLLTALTQPMHSITVPRGGSKQFNQKMNEKFGK